jgi:SAM-dependent methyltransferase
MIGLSPTPLEDSFRDVLVSIAREHRLVSVDDPARLAPKVQALTEAYNDPKLRGLAGIDHRAARLAFWFPRDVPKMAGAAREAIATGRVAMPADRPLRVLDVGAGLGASHRGLARALAAAGARGTIEALAIDADGPALQLCSDIAKKRPREGDVVLQVRTAQGDAARALPERGERFDVVLLGQVLTELHLELDEAARVEAHRELVRSALARTTTTGLVIVVEPALRPRSRHLQRVRGALVESGARIFAPCLHEGRCPLLGREGDWCHEDLAIDLPEWLVPIAKRAGLRWEGLTFSYLAVGNEGPTLRERLPQRPGIERAVSPAMPTKGKLEVILCGDPLRPAAPDDDPLGPNGVRAGRLDREASEKNGPIATLRRGDVVEIRGPLDEKLRVRSQDDVSCIVVRDDAQGR